MATITVPVMAELFARGEKPEVLFWVGCAGSFDQRAQRVTRAMVKILTHLNVSFAVLGAEEGCTGDPSKRAGNEFQFQMQARTNIQVLNQYEVKKIITTCPHCFNTLKNEYPEMGGNYEVLHHTQFLQQLIDSGRLRVSGGIYKGKKLTFHDPCYLGRANQVYEAPRALIEALDAELVEMKRCRQNSFCCGAGGAQLFKESEKGKKEIHYERTDEALNTGAGTIAAACPFCITMITDGVTMANKNESVKVYDVSELIAQTLQL
jgi:Fe-S oxidoreductase